MWSYREHNKNTLCMIMAGGQGSRLQPLTRDRAKPAVHFGGTYRINGSTYVYADGEREFGGQWNRKWQWNVGIHWTF